MLFSGFDTGNAVSRIRPLVTVDRGDEFLDYAAGTATPVDGVIVAPVTGMEALTPGRDATMAQFSILDFDSDRGFWQDTDHVDIDGTEYQIEGSVREWPSPTGELAHTQLLVNRWEG